MNDSKIELKSINDLLGMNFFIPSYQRGYRWTERQVEDLLEDINAFMPNQIEKTDKKTWYCLQPIIVKKYDEQIKNKNKLEGEWYEVIDGQQRLTSIFLIIHYANEMWVGKQKIPEFQIQYETRDKSFEFLKKIKVNESDEVDINNDNIDFFYITTTYKKIHDWVKHKKDFDNNDFQSKLKSTSKVIWYEVADNKDAIEIFTRINMGKIPLTNAELIKALFLNSSNFSKTDAEERRLRQLEIASEWDRIEYSLQNDELWYFINNSANELPTRIEYLFNIMKNIDGDNNDNDEYSIFRFFLKKFKSKDKDEIDANWKEIKRIFQTIEEWFNDRELYHKIGYLIATGEKGEKKIEGLLKEVKNKQKKEFRQQLDKKIAEKVQCNNLKELDYNDRNKSLIKNILLWHNIQTMLLNKNETSRFPFNRFKKEIWDIEHIHAVATEMPKNKQHRIDWLNSSKECTKNNDLISKITNFIDNYDAQIKLILIVLSK